uniref:DUF4939 domain-containing protein n=1 Tax=Xenopus tropicalis TaxID=8364 RepID=A0A6I8QPE5_XENTR
MQGSVLLPLLFNLFINGAVSATKEPKMPLPEKYSGNRITFRGFINQCKQIFQLQPQQYSTDSRRVGLILTLLSGEALNWASPLIEQQSPLLSDFNGFLAAMSLVGWHTLRRRFQQKSLWMCLIKERQINFLPIGHMIAL